MSTDEVTTTIAEIRLLDGEATGGRRSRRHKRRDGLFSRNNWWWINYTGADGKRH